MLEGTQIGDSIAVNGVCLTVIRMDKDHFTADVMPETLRRSNLGQLKTGSKVNLERAMAADGRFGGQLSPDTLTAQEQFVPCSRRATQCW
ncbi:MAG: riboflavin synthase [Ruminococcus callidus]